MNFYVALYRPKALKRSDMARV